MSKIKSGEIRNPHGRPKNSGHRQKIFDSLVSPHKEELISTAIELARSGNEQMLKLFLERLLPAKASDDPIPSCMLEGSLSEQGKTVLTLITTSQLTLSQGQSLLDSLLIQAKLIETDELDRRLRFLEERI
jgi:hypothetical protein